MTWRSYSRFTAAKPGRAVMGEASPHRGEARQAHRASWVSWWWVLVSDRAHSLSTESSTTNNLDLHVEKARAEDKTPLRRAECRSNWKDMVDGLEDGGGPGGVRDRIDVWAVGGSSGTCSGTVDSLGRLGPSQVWDRDRPMRRTRPIAARPKLKAQSFRHLALTSGQVIRGQRHS